EKARDHIGWLESPIHPQNVAHWAKERGPRMLLVIAAALFLLLLVRFSARGVARALVGRRRGARSVGTGRADTLAFSFRSASRVVIVVMAVMLVLQEGGVDITTVLGGAAIMGVAIAFGAQDLMKDYFSGFLILAEDQYQLGDLITIRGITGTVESVNMRVTVASWRRWLKSPRSYKTTRIGRGRSSAIPRCSASTSSRSTGWSSSSW
ncbi:MAG: mechanosensitive ion channel, partial [Deltaproteobacteria bacterium]|nr:mechanosensitive ion channel [Deltaproteobacteria bacterium]